MFSFKRQTFISGIILGVFVSLQFLAQSSAAPSADPPAPAQTSTVPFPTPYPFQTPEEMAKAREEKRQEVQRNIDQKEFDACQAEKKVKDDAMRKGTAACLQAGLGTEIESCASHLNDCQSGNTSGSTSEVKSICGQLGNQAKLDFASEQVKDLESKKKEAKSDVDTKQKELRDAVKNNAEQEQKLTDDMANKTKDLQDLVQLYSLEVGKKTAEQKKNINDLNKAIEDQKIKIKLLKTAEAKKVEMAYSDAVNKAEEACADQATQDAAGRKAIRDGKSAAGTLNIGGFSKLIDSTGSANNSKDNKAWEKKYNYCLAQRKTRDMKLLAEQTREVNENQNLADVAGAESTLNDLLNKTSLVLTTGAADQLVSDQGLELKKQQLRTDLDKTQSRLTQIHNQYLQDVQRMNLDIQAAQKIQTQDEADYAGYKQTQDQLTKPPNNLTAKSTHAYDSFKKIEESVTAALAYSDDVNDNGNAIIPAECKNASDRVNTNVKSDAKSDK